jgi:pimeloyl-ACP methyl ester carboxylesterase
MLLVATMLGVVAGCAGPDSSLPTERRAPVAAHAVGLSTSPQTPELIGGSYVIAEVTTTHSETVASEDPVLDIRTGEPGPAVYTEFPASVQRIETGVATSGHQVYGELVVTPDPEYPDEDRDVIVVGPMVREQVPGTPGAPPPRDPCDYGLPECIRPERSTAGSDVIGAYTLDGTPDLDGLPLLMHYFHQEYGGSALTALAPGVAAARGIAVGTLPPLAAGTRVVEATSARVVLEEPQPVSVDGRGLRGTDRATWLASDDGWRLAEHRRVLFDSTSRTGVRRIEERTQVRIIAVRRNPASEAGFVTRMRQRAVTAGGMVPVPAAGRLRSGDALPTVVPTCDPNTYRVRDVMQPGGAHGVVFAHGFFSSPCAWGLAAVDLRTRLGFTAVLATQSGWRDSLQWQGAVLQHEMAGLGQQDWVMVGHSMGGLVSRVVAQRALQGATPHVRGVLTIATPHAGAPIARATEVGIVSGVVVGMTIAAATLRLIQRLRVLRGAPPNAPGPEWLVAAAIGLNAGAAAGGSLAWWFDQRTQSLRELQPGSSQLDAINGGSEAGLRRVRVVAQPKTGWLSVRTFCDLSGQDGDACARNTGRTFRRLKFHAVLNGVIGGTFMLAGQGGAGAAFVGQSLRQLGAAALMWSGDELFKIMVGGGLGRRSDGVVPVASQRAWNADQEYLLDGGWTPSHNGLLRDPVTIENTRDGLQRRLLVPPR